MASITFDTNIFALEPEVESVMREQGHSHAHASVTDRELENTDFVTASSTSIAEPWVLGESKLGSCALASIKTRDDLNRILDILSTRSFPRGKFGELTAKQKNQFRDALIFATHVREQRDIFVSNDLKAYFKHGKHAELEQQFGTRIMTYDEFRAFIGL